MTTVDGSNAGSPRLPGAWNDLRVLARERWPRLTSDDLDAIAGDRVRLGALVRRRYGVDPDEAERQLDGFLQGWLPPR